MTGVSEPDGFVVFLDTHHAALLRTARALVGDAHTAEDLLQEVLLRASRRWDRIGALDKPVAYVRRMLVHETVSWRRRLTRLVFTAEPPDVVLHDDHAARVTERDALDRRLDRLPPRQRAVLVLRYYEGLGDDDIAATLGCSAGTVRAHASRALASLRVDDDSGGTATVPVPTTREARA
ncbi:SigE family RNA polymerase sigma factor [Jatrophihabitans sp. YIM 134969]